MARIPFVVGAIPLFVVFYITLVTWWWAMSALWRTGNVAEGIFFAYLLPGLFWLTVALARKGGSTLKGIAHFIVLGVIGLIMGFRVFTLQPFVSLSNIASDLAPFLGIAFISGVMTIMTYPKAGVKTYHRYRSPLFIGSVIFMPLFIAVAAVLSSPLEALLKGALILSIMVGFWASAAWLASRRTQGEYVPGLEVKPLMPFRPDVILPGGVNYVKGVIMTGLGFMIMSQPENVFPPPVWNWWGFVLAFWGIISLIPLRGMFKMISGRRPRMLGEEGAFGLNAASWAREVWLYVGLLILMYGFLNAFMGAIPFTVLSPFDPRMKPPHPLYGLIGAALLTLAFVVLVPIRAWYKTKLLEGVETMGQLAVKQVLLWIGSFLTIYGFVTLFMGQFMYPHPQTNPLGFAVGLPLFIGGVVLITVFRPFALRNEFLGMIRIMVGSIASLPEDKRKEIMTRRLNCVLGMPESQRSTHVRAMIQGILACSPEELKSAMFKTNVEVVSNLPDDKRKIMMGEMDEAMRLAK